MRGNVDRVLRAEEQAPFDDPQLVEVACEGLDRSPGTPLEVLHGRVDRDEVPPYELGIGLAARPRPKLPPRMRADEAAAILASCGT